MWLLHWPNLKTAIVNYSCIAQISCRYSMVFIYVTSPLTESERADRISRTMCNSYIKQISFIYSMVIYLCIWLLHWPNLSVLMVSWLNLKAAIINYSCIKQISCRYSMVMHACNFGTDRILRLRPSIYSCIKQISFRYSMIIYVWNFSTSLEAISLMRDHKL